MKKEYWALLVFVLIIVLQWIGLGFYGQIRFIFLIIILAVSYTHLTLPTTPYV